MSAWTKVNFKLHHPAFYIENAYAVTLSIYGNYYEFVAKILKNWIYASESIPIWSVKQDSIFDSYLNDIWYFWTIKLILYQLIYTRGNIVYVVIFFRKLLYEISEMQLNTPVCSLTNFLFWRVFKCFGETNRVWLM